MPEAEIVGLALELAADALVFRLDSVSFSTGDPPEFAKIYEWATEAIEEDPSNKIAYFKRGIVCQSKQWYPHALADFMEVLRLDPHHGRAWMLMSEVLAQLGHFEQAQKARKAALEIDPDLS